MSNRQQMLRFLSVRLIQTKHSQNQFHTNTGNTANKENEQPRMKSVENCSKAANRPQTTLAKRAFGMDLKNVQAPEKFEHKQFRVPTAGDLKKALKTRSYGSQQPMNSTTRPNSSYAPQILSQACSNTSSLSQMKTVGDLKQYQTHSQINQTSHIDYNAIKNLIGGLNIGQKIPTRSSSRALERKSAAFLSQDRNNNSAVDQVIPGLSQRINNSFGQPSSTTNRQARAMTGQRKFSDNIPDNKEEKNDKLRKFHQRMYLINQKEVDESDISHLNDPQACAEYAKEIFDNCKTNHLLNVPVFGYLESQEDLHEKMRSILVDWLIDVHLKFKLLPETLFLTINLIDRYLAKEKVTRAQLQLIGVTAMLIASKYEEIYAPIVKDFVYITDNAYSKPEILEAERKMITILNFDITFTSQFRFLERFALIAKSDNLVFNLSRYLLELSLVNYKMLKYSPLTLAAGSIYLSMKMTRQKNPWSEKLAKHSSLTESEIRPCAKELFTLLQNAQNSSLQAVRKKFSLPVFGEVARIKLEHSSGSSSNQKPTE